MYSSRLSFDTSKTRLKLVWVLYIIFLPVMSHAQMVQYDYNSSIGGISELTSSFLFDVDDSNQVYVLEESYTPNAYYYLVRKFDENNRLVDSVALEADSSSTNSPSYFSAFQRSPSGLFFTLDSYYGMLYAYSSDGTMTRRFELRKLFRMEQEAFYPIDMVVGKNDIIYFLFTDGVGQIDTKGNFIGLWRKEGLYAGAMAVDNNGIVYLAQDSDILSFDSKGMPIDTISIVVYGYENSIKEIARDDSDRLFVMYNSGYLNSGYAVYTTGGKLIGGYQDGHYHVNESGDTVYAYFGDLNQLIYRNKKLYISEFQYSFSNSAFPYDRVAIFDESEQPPLGIYGPNRIPLNIPVTYQILPELRELYPYCHYSGENLKRLTSVDPEYSGQGGSRITVVANAKTTSGTLTCRLYYSGGEDSVSIAITPYAATYAITPVACDAKGYVLCGDGTINSFHFNDLNRTGMECGVLGYKDYTLDNMVANANIGQLYNATISLSVSDSARAYYAGIWIDLNNDGDFDDPDEFGGSAIAFEGMVRFAHARIPQSTDYVGDVRLRARVRSAYPFMAGESCILPGDAGETQDYTLRIARPLTLAASEALTPNNDGKNDHFVIRGVDQTYDNHLIITDAFGKIVKEVRNYKNDWPSRNDHDLLPEGTYYYFFENGPGSINGYFVVNY